MIDRIMIKLFSVLLKMNTELFGKNLLLCIVVVIVTLGISAVVHEILCRFVPWMIGKQIKGENSN